MTEYAYVYILSNSFRKLYIGVTGDLPARVSQHKRRTNPNCHTTRYGIDELVYFERFTSIAAAIKREKVLKGWLRVRKLELIISTNPLWQDLSADWGNAIKPFNLNGDKEVDAFH
jgi:putative endonuclease